MITFRDGMAVVPRKGEMTFALGHCGPSGDGARTEVQELTATVRQFVHDSNNLMLIISLNLEEALESLPETHPLYEALSLVMGAADSSIALNAQLLAGLPRRK